MNELGVPAAFDLKVSEGFIDPIGFHDSLPTFSWKLPPFEGLVRQSAYQIVAANSIEELNNDEVLWDTGKVESDASTGIPYAGKALESRQSVYWKVKYWDQDMNPSSWSNPARIEMGLLDNNDWQADWIGLDEREVNRVVVSGKEVDQPRVQYLRHCFAMEKEVRKARVYIAAKGLFELQLNGQKVGKDYLVPGWTPYHKRIESIAYDVTDQLQSGENVIGVALAEGWYAGRLTALPHLWGDGPSLRVMCQLEVTYADGSTDIVVSNDEWCGTLDGPIRHSGIYDGEIYDANKEIPEWSRPAFNDETWSTVSSDSIESEPRICPKRHLPVRVMEELKPANITHPIPNVSIFDLSQNMVGIIRVAIPVKKDQAVHIRFAEMLNSDGSLYTENYRSARSEISYIPAVDGFISWQPTFTFFGFRYVEISGYDTDIKPTYDWVTGIVLHSDFEKTGTFNSSNKLLNQLQSNISWGIRGNFLDIPTDCPQRDERLGWTGDAHIIAPASMFNFDMHAFWSAWMESMREEQFDNGSIPISVPDAIKNGAHCTGWGDAAIIIPWEIYLRTGDKTILVENFDMMRRMLEFYKEESSDCILDMVTFGDWLQPYSSRSPKGDTPRDLIGTAYFGYVASLMERIAGILECSEDADKCSRLRKTIEKRFTSTFFDAEGRLKTNAETQTGYLLAIAFDLISHELQKLAFMHLTRLIDEAGNHLRTGFLGTPLLPLVLDKMGKPELMYTILMQETYPSWFYSIRQGATTMWERWNSYSYEDGFGPVEMNSFNHYAYGAIGQWMYERIAGLAPDPMYPGYKHFFVKPFPGGGLTHASSKLETPYGAASSKWEIKGDKFLLEVVVPPNTSATVHFPYERSPELLEPGKHVFKLRINYSNS